MSLLEKLLTLEDCAKCQFCCSYRRRSLWETIIFTPEEVEKLKQKYHDAKFKKIENSNFENYTINIDDLYKTDDPNEEVFCPFNKGKGCVIPEEEKKLECSAWPFRVMRKDGKLVIAFCRDCPVFAKKNLNEIQAFLESGLDKKLIEYAAKIPAYVRDYRENYQVIKLIGDD